MPVTSGTHAYGAFWKATPGNSSLVTAVPFSSSSGVPSNIAFKGTHLGEAFFGSRVSSAQGRCSGFIVGAPLNLTLGVNKEKTCAVPVMFV